MGRWFQDHGCKTTLDIGAMTGGCIRYISRLGIRMDGVQFTPDIQRLAARELRMAGVRSKLYVSPIFADLDLPAGARYAVMVAPPLPFVAKQAPALFVGLTGPVFASAVIIDILSKQWSPYTRGVPDRQSPAEATGKLVITTPTG